MSIRRANAVGLVALCLIANVRAYHGAVLQSSLSRDGQGRITKATEPFIGGGTFVSIKERKHSEALSIRYDTAAQRLNLPTAAQEVLAEELEAEGEAGGTA